jgi:hypothetical protein
MNLKTFLLGTCSAIVIAGLAQAETLTIATVNNGDMVRMQTLTDDFTKANPDISWNGSRSKRTCCANASPRISQPRAASTTSDHRHL